MAAGALDSRGGRFWEKISHPTSYEFRPLDRGDCRVDFLGRSARWYDDTQRA